MHISEGFLPPLHAAAWTLVSAGEPNVLADPQLVATARLRRPSVAVLWDALPHALRPEQCPRSVEELAAWVVSKRPGVSA